MSCHSQRSIQTHCPICLNIITKAIQLPCSHVLCDKCISTLKKLEHKDYILLELTGDNDSLDLTSCCPMCRYEFPLSEARHNPEYDEKIRATIGEEAFAQEVEEMRQEQTELEQHNVLVVGNVYKKIATDSRNSNKWTFFVKMLNANVEDYVKRVDILLHPTFRPSRISRTRAPFKIVRLGWGTFTIVCTVYFHREWHQRDLSIG
eukprot:CAMPEP_0117444754 /NCGR_PEP_ID=MMETSP0759-20121206/5419_1 /TAXON_ID=63605 /ORGANISM="Percolomonas cosmopolitus, Strain WS" /LENGTH=204 /DNA_ID=CAMNT_0005236861 /DNA_START=44 /DNA_END=658 /DNA_ORIENTATION=+